MANKTPPCKVYPKWTEAKFNQFVRSALRKAWSRWPPKFDVMNEAKRTVTGKRHKYEYQCSSCENWFKATEVQVDHIDPVGSSKYGWDQFIERLFVGPENLQVLCKGCHNDKSKRERGTE